MKRSVSLFLLIKVLVLSLALTSVAEKSEIANETVPSLKAYRINPHPPVIDGDLSDQIWKSSKIHYAKKFTQLEPDEGTAATESTMVAIAYDDEALYAAFWCYDSEPDKIMRQLVRRDRHSASDDITVCIDAFHDHQTSFRFRVNAAGVQRDERVYNDNAQDDSWDGIWYSDVKIQPWGWSAELKIPYHCLRFVEKEEHIWGLNLTRNIERKGEYVKWSFTPSAEGGFTSKFGHLTGLTNIKPTGHMEILPYAVSKAEIEPKSIGNPDGRELLGNAGFDMKYALSSNLILDATVNPDFGQVELDQPVLNLSTYETYFSEKRPFFIEGMDLFETEFHLFYSRRIGRSPSADVDDDSLAYYTNYPDASTILGATKLTGKLSSGTSIAFLTAITEKEI
ncbi:MAG: carbohydrate binding family 9 domain-containing protein, partial [candidate division Zixibacteria bacterium]|nr:carbohydrate binding family 9 domain-containing protein [candidate division Zixibacteria bacterium]